MKMLILAILSFFLFGSLNVPAQDLEISDEIDSYEEAWRAKDVAALKTVLNEWEQEDELDPALWYLKVDFYMSLEIDKVAATNACTKLKNLGVQFESPELIEASNERSDFIAKFADADFVQPTNVEIQAYLGSFPTGNPVIPVAIRLQEFRK
tara:strand:+ start:745 stop:1200 length:456 start_codon:yes stop_codon:yes gene_type:complete